MLFLSPKTKHHQLNSLNQNNFFLSVSYFKKNIQQCNYCLLNCCFFINIFAKNETDIPLAHFIFIYLNMENVATCSS